VRRTGRKGLNRRGKRAKCGRARDGRKERKFGIDVSAELGAKRLPPPNRDRATHAELTSHV